MKILFLSSWYPNRIQPRLGNFIQRHAEAVALHDEVASLFVTSDAGCKNKFEMEESVINNIFTVNVYYNKITSNIPLISSVHKSLRYLHGHFIGLKKIKKHFGKIDLVHQNILYPSGTFALLLKIFYKLPYIITEHSTEYQLSKNSSDYLPSAGLRKKIAAGAFCISPVTDDLKNAMLQNGLKGNYEVVPNVVNAEIFFHSSSKKENTKITFLHISSLVDRQKNISGMLKVIHRLAEKENDFRLIIIGDEDPAPHIKLATDLGLLNAIVFFEGTKTATQIAEAMQSADCFLMFSNYENFPCVIAEAMSCGLPVVSSDVGGIDEHVNSSNGMLVKPKDENALLLALQQIKKNIVEKKYDPEKISRYAHEHFSRETVSKKFHDIYSRALKIHV